MIGNLTVNLVILFGAGFALVLGLGQLSRTDRSPAGDILLSGSLFFCLSGIQFHIAAQNFGIVQAHPRLLFAQHPLLYSLGPLLMLNFQRILNAEFSFGRAHGYHFVLPGLDGVLCVFYSFRDRDFLVDLLHRPPTIEAHLDVLPMVVSLFGAYLSIIAYLALTLRELSFLWKADAQRREPLNRIALAFALLGLVIAVNALVGQLASMELMHLGSAMLSLLLVMIYITGQRYPKFLPILKREVQYGRSRLSGVNVASVLAQLESKMSTERLYLDEDLTLPDLAAELGISTHQLSEILNDHLGFSFKNYINDFRIKAACDLLASEPERSILSIAMAVGFNSKSAFNRAFVTRVRRTPSGFRRDRMRNSPAPK